MIAFGVDLSARLRRVSDRPLPWFLAVLGVTYTIGYLAHPDLPGVFSHPLGWWDWFDQGEYLKSARAFSLGDLTPANHFYPPGYPLLGAVFIRLLPVHPFFAVNVAFFLLYATAFVRVARHSIHETWAMALFLLIACAYLPIFEQYLIPWTTIPVAAILGGLAWLALNRSPTASTVLLFGALAGAIVPFRPSDVVMALPLLVVFVSHSWSCSRDLEIRRRLRRHGLQLILMTAAAALGPLLYVALNRQIHGSAFGSYVQVATDNGFFLSSLPHKLVSIFVDAEVLHLEPRAALLQKNPWMFLSFVGIVIAWLDGWSILSAIGAAIVVQFLFYLCYADLVPHGLWRYKNVHYFAWAYPYLALFAVLVIVDLWRRRRPLRIAVVSAILLPLFSVGLARKDIPGTIAVEQRPSGQSVATLRFTRPTPLEVIDFKSAAGNYQAVYFDRPHAVVDGRMLTSFFEARALMAPFGIRLVFIHPIRASHVEVTLQRGIELPADPRLVTAAHYGFVLTPPRWLWSP